MKKLFVAFMLFASAFAVSAQEFNPLSNLNNHPYGFEMRQAEKFLMGNSKGVGDNYDVKYHRFVWTIDPDTSYIAGSVTTYFVTSVSGFTTISFELSSLLTVDSVKYGGNNVSSMHASDQLDISLGVTLPSGRLDSVTIYYQGNPGAGAGFGSFIKDAHNGTPIIWTLSEPYGSRDWWPCKSILSDKIDSIDLFVTTPQAYRVASNGLLMSETLQGSDKTFHWRHRYPIAAYLIAIAVTNYSVYSDYVPLGADTLEMLNYVYPENLVAFQAGTHFQVEVLQLYDSLFGEYPYIKEKYGHAQFGWGGGMEHQTMSFVINEGFDLLAHEMAHQWFGDKVTCNSWHDIWVNEGFATYCQGITLQTAWGGVWWPVWLQQRITDITALPDGSVYCYDTTQVSNVFDWRLSYQKGAMVLHMLRWIMGDDAFFQGMKNIMADPLLAYGYAGTADIQRNFETTSGMNLDEYFTDWIYRQGHPVYTISNLIQSDSTVQVTIQQIPSHNSVSYFELPVPLWFKSTTHDTILVFNNTFSGQTFTAEPGFIPDSIFFDPELKLLAVLDTMYVTPGSGFPETQALKAVLSPNPAGDFLTLNWSGDQVTKVEIYSTDGRLQLRLPSTDPHSIRMDISNLKAGVYLIKMVSPNNALTLHFVKL